MRTPNGEECKYFYGNYFRGKSDEECRLMPEERARWSSEVCKSCPMPSILRANSCEHMRFTGKITKNVFTMFRARVEIDAYCEKAERRVQTPQVGCGECHPNLDILEIKE